MYVWLEAIGSRYLLSNISRCLASEASLSQQEQVSQPLKSLPPASEQNSFNIVVTQQQC